MTVYIACAKDEEAQAEELAVPLRAAGYEVIHDGTTMVGGSFVGEAARAVAQGWPVVVCATARAAGSRWAQKIINAAQLGGSNRVFVVVMEEDAATDHLALGTKVTRYYENPAAAIQELLAALVRHFPTAASPAVTPVADGQFLDQPTALTAFDLDALRAFRGELRSEAAARYPDILSPWQFLERVGLLVDASLTRTGALLFVTDSTAVCPSAMVKCVRYHGTDRSAAREIVTIEGPVPQQIIMARKFVAGYAQRGEVPSADSARAQEVYDLPMIAVREIIANALVHRDYANADACVHVRLFDDRLEVSSPGDWCSRALNQGEEVDLGELEGQSVKRNFRLAHLLSWIKLVEGEGSGIPTAVSDCVDAHSRRPIVVQEQGFVTVTLWRQASGRQQLDLRVPRTLPPPVRNFTGREWALRYITEAFENDNQPVVITGISGIGKTALALQWANSVHGRFPDGQLYVNLADHSSDEPLHPEQVLGGVLRVLGLLSEQIPSDEEALSSLFRSLVADKRMLFIFENARHADLIMRLLPGGQNMVVVTSRMHMSDLVATQGFAAVVLAAFTHDEGVEFLANRVGSAVAAAPELAAEVVELCAGLPLALALTGAQLVGGLTLPSLVGELRDEEHRLDTFDETGMHLSVRRAFLLSYRELTADAAKLFRYLGLHRGPDFARHVAARLVNRRVLALDELYNFHLVERVGADRYRMHDLLHLLARELVEAQETPEQRRGATQRMLDYYLHTGHAAAMMLDPHRSPILAGEPGDRTIGTYQDALAWFTVEHRSILAMVRVAAEQGLDDHAWKLTWTLATYLDRHGHSRDHIDALHIGLKAANRLGDRRVQALLNRLLGHALTRLGHYEDSHRHHEESLQVFRELGDQEGEAHTCHALGRVCEKLERFADALAYAERARDLYELLGNRVRQARALNQVGWCQAKLEQYREALDSCERALRLFEEQHDSYYQAVALDSLGYVHHQLGAHETAVSQYRRSIAIYGSTSDNQSVANALSRLGDAYETVGDTAAADRAWREALRILRALEHPDAALVRRKLPRAASGD